MDIGQLFLNLGIKGTEKTVGAVTEVKKGLQETASVSLEAKAAIVGAMYALERLFATSGKAGTDLTNFNAVTGESIQTLQKYQYAGRQVGISNDEMAGSFKSLQGIMTKTMMGEGAPKGLARVSLLTGGISQKDIQEFAKRPELLIQKLQEYASKETNIGIRNETLKSFGISDSMVAGLSRKAFNPSVLGKAPTYSDREVGQLDKANIAWSNLGNKIEMAVGHFNAQHGLQLVTGISKIADAVFKVVEAFEKLAEKMHLFDGIAKIFDGIEGLVNFAGKGAEGVNAHVSEVMGDRKGVFHGLLNQGKELKNELIKDAPHMSDMLTHLLGGGHYANQVAPPMRAIAGSSSTQNNSANVTNIFQHGGVDPQKTYDSVKKAVSQAYRQMNPNKRGN